MPHMSAVDKSHGAVSVIAFMLVHPHVNGRGREFSVAPVTNVQFNSYFCLGDFLLLNSDHDLRHKSAAVIGHNADNGHTGFDAEHKTGLVDRGHCGIA